MITGSNRVGLREDDKFDDRLRSLSDTEKGSPLPPRLSTEARSVQESRRVSTNSTKHMIPTRPRERTTCPVNCVTSHINPKNGNTNIRYMDPYTFAYPKITTRFISFALEATSAPSASSLRISTFSGAYHQNEYPPIAIPPSP